jgi:hypothetical protein
VIAASVVARAAVLVVERQVRALAAAIDQARGAAASAIHTGHAGWTLDAATPAVLWVSRRIDLAAVVDLAVAI